MRYPVDDVAQLTLNLIPPTSRISTAFTQPTTLLSPFPQQFPHPTLAMWRPRRPRSFSGATTSLRSHSNISTPTITTVPRSYATHVRTTPHQLPPTYFLPSTPRHLTTNSSSSYSSSEDGNDHKSPDERTLALGHTIRILQERMPTLLQSPLPTEILSPSISLHLFPSTHPHLPAVRGRVAYIAALWTAPVAWGRLPGGNTTLEVMSERMLEGERLRIRWRAEARDGGKQQGGIRKGTTEVEEGEFSGIFLFEFDEKGRVCKHVIENSEEDDGERLAGVITVTEWLIRKAKGDPAPEGGKLGGLAWHFQRITKQK